MRLYVWTEVLYDYTAGMIVALAPDLDTALHVARIAPDLPARTAEEMGREEPRVTELPGCEDVDPRVWAVNGGG